MDSAVCAYGHRCGNGMPERLFLKEKTPDHIRDAAVGKFLLDDTVFYVGSAAFCFHMAAATAGACHMDGGILRAGTQDGRAAADTIYTVADVCGISELCCISFKRVTGNTGQFTTAFLICGLIKVRMYIRIVKTPQGAQGDVSKWS